MTQSNGVGRRIVLYARASSDEQAHSVAGQLADLREFAYREGHEVVAEIKDQSQKRHDLDRPGIDELLDVAAGGGVDEVHAWAWDRYGQFPVPEQLAIMLAADGVTMRSLDDAGEGEDAEDMRVIKSLFSRREQRSRARRTRKGVRDKALRGQHLGAASQPRYGFRWKRDEEGTRVGYEVVPETMENVRRVFGLLADGESVSGVRRELEQAGIPAPGGGRHWSATTVRGIALNDVYRPHRASELAGLVSADVLARLEPEREYGIAWAGQRRTSFKPGRGKTRAAEWAPRNEWIAVPVDLSGSGLDRTVVDRARAAIEGNRRPSKLDGYLYELSGGVLRCGACGRAMQVHRRAKSGGGHNNYYRCRPSVGEDACENRKSHRAEVLEHDAASMFERYASRGTLLELYDRAVEEREGDKGSRGTLERRAALTERLGVLAKMRRSFQDQQAEDLMTLPELRERLAELDEEKAAISDELRAAEDETEAVRRLEAARESLSQAVWYDPVHSDWEEDPDAVMPSEYLTLAAPPEEIHRAYNRFGARFAVDVEGVLTLTMNLDLEDVGKSLQEERTSSGAATG
jgi:DNA invertase Pin-like site-specific DNA recombinase